MNDDAKEFLLEEYKELNNTLHKNEERGEKRLEFFVSLSSVVIGAVGFIVKDQKDIDVDINILYLIIIFLLTGLILIGFVILNRLRKRNNKTDSFKDDINRIRDIFKAIEPELLKNYSAFTKRKDSDAKDDAKETSRKLTSVNAIAKIIIAVLIGVLAIFVTLVISSELNCAQPKFDRIFPISIFCFIASAVLLYTIKDDDKHGKK